MEGRHKLRCTHTLSMQGLASSGQVTRAQQAGGSSCDGARFKRQAACKAVWGTLAATVVAISS